MLFMDSREVLKQKAGSVTRLRNPDGKIVRILAEERFKGKMSAMPGDESSSLRTRPSLLNRLKSGDDVPSWNEFYRIYGKLVRDFALRAGLNDSEADEVVQETAIAISRHLPEYRYDPKVCRFKTWLLNQASWRIKDQLKKRGQTIARFGSPPPVAPNDDTARTATINRVPDPAVVNLDALFEVEWRKNLFAAALERVKQKFSLKQLQIFDLLVLKEWPAADLAKALGVTLANVYVTKHRVSSAVAKETRRLEKELDREAARRAG
jgi:RNA polymerase sigma-70 factor (ECF subfamily)